MPLRAKEVRPGCALGDDHGVVAFGKDLLPGVLEVGEAGVGLGLYVVQVPDGAEGVDARDFAGVDALDAEPGRSKRGFAGWPRKS